MAKYEFKSAFKMGNRNPEITTVVYADTYFGAVRKMDEVNGFATVVLDATREGKSLIIDHDTAEQRRGRIDALPDLAPSAPAASVLDARIDKFSVEHYAMAVVIDRIEAKVDKLTGDIAAGIDREFPATIKNLTSKVARLEGTIYNLEGDRNELRNMLDKIVDTFERMFSGTPLGEARALLTDATLLKQRIATKETR